MTHLFLCCWRQIEPTQHKLHISGSITECRGLNLWTESPRQNKSNCAIDVAQRPSLTGGVPGLLLLITCPRSLRHFHRVQRVQTVLTTTDKCANDSSFNTHFEGLRGTHSIRLPAHFPWNTIVDPCAFSVNRRLVSDGVLLHSTLTSHAYLQSPPPCHNIAFMASLIATPYANSFSPLKTSSDFLRLPAVRPLCRETTSFVVCSSG